MCKDVQMSSLTTRFLLKIPRKFYASTIVNIIPEMMLTASALDRTTGLINGWFEWPVRPSEPRAPTCRTFRQNFAGQKLRISLNGTSSPFCHQIPQVRLSAA
ncbi:hypothetical protein XENOCAPTIV_025944 [Xenoophorus captivus]|uniref:Uncharacterized protein n=1 Tax=Xenoophorus captivus TaxID=1517983 RepID=A0ABV0RS68_9TELE